MIAKGSQASTKWGASARALVVLVNRISIQLHSLSAENRKSSSFLQKSILKPLIIAPKNLYNSFRRSSGIMQYGSPSSQIVNIEIRKISPLNDTIPSFILTSTSTPPKHFFATRYHSNERADSI